jgi:low affinity Fe/Cu permease
MTSSGGAVMAGHGGLFKTSARWQIAGNTIVWIITLTS